MVEFRVNRKPASVSESSVPAESDEDGNLLARQIVALDGVTYTQAQQQIRELTGFDLNGFSPTPMSVPNVDPSINDTAPDGQPSNDGADVIVRELREERN